MWLHGKYKSYNLDNVESVGILLRETGKYVLKLFMHDVRAIPLIEYDTEDDAVYYMGMLQKHIDSIDGRDIIKYEDLLPIKPSGVVDVQGSKL